MARIPPSVAMTTSFDRVDPISHPGILLYIFPAIRKSYLLSAMLQSIHVLSKDYLVSLSSGDDDDNFHPGELISRLIVVYNKLFAIRLLTASTAA